MLGRIITIIIIIFFFFKAENSWSLSKQRFSYANADIRVEETEDGNGDGDLITTWIQTKNSKPCGMPGEYILILPQFFTDTTNKYGDKGIVDSFSIMIKANSFFNDSF